MQGINILLYLIVETAESCRTGQPHKQYESLIGIIPLYPVYYCCFIIIGGDFRVNWQQLVAIMCNNKLTI